MNMRSRNLFISTMTSLALIGFAFSMLAGCGKNSVAQIDDTEVADENKDSQTEDSQAEDKQQTDKIEQVSYRYQDFYTGINQDILSQNAGNVVYSPLNIYMALGLLAESTDGNTRNQILSVLSEPDIEAVRENSKQLYEKAYRDETDVKLLFANSVWLSDSLSYKTKGVDLLKDYYNASVFSGTMGSDEYNKQFQEWLNESTNGFLKEAAANQKFSSETVLALASALYYKGNWADQFYASANTRDNFHGEKGDQQVEFMHSGEKGAVITDNYTAVQKQLNGATMTFYLPNEGKTLEDLYGDESIYALDKGYVNEDKTVCNVIFSVPKFDIKADLQLPKTLASLGMTDVFDETKADFSPIIENKAYLSSINHSARVKIDEEGCEAAAFTAMQMTGTAIIDKTINFVLDRPFIFVIRDDNNIPMFVGAVKDL